MSLKRRNSSSIEPDSPRSRLASSDVDDYDDAYVEYEQPVGHSKPHTDVTTGQTGAFPGLGDDDELFYGPATDGLDYLRMVRSERKGIPPLLTSTQHLKARQEQDAEQGAGGHYYDGAYTARTIVGLQDVATSGPAQVRYYESLIAQFRLIRATMRCIPPLEDVEALGDSRPIFFPANVRAAREAWEAQILNHDPHPVQVACMDAESTLQVVKLMARRLTHFLKPEDFMGVQRIGAWFWAILGRCPDRGELGSQEISDLRALAKKANEVTEWLESRSSGGLDHVLGSDDAAVNDAEDVTQEQESTFERPTLNDEGGHPVSENDGGSSVADAEELKLQKLLMLDMIITIVGEVYGQRDLLEMRRIWTR